MADNQRLSRTLQRDSHDLSLSPRNVTRDSLVTNMLMSLDQFSVIPSSSSNNQYADDEPDSPRFFDIPRYRPGHADDDDYDDDDLDTLPPAHAATWPAQVPAQASDLYQQQQRQQRHRHQAQPSYSSDLDIPTDDESPRAHLYSRQRRSNSSITYQDAAYAQARSHRQPPPRTRDNHLRGGRGSRSSRGSSVTSFDQGSPAQGPVSGTAGSAAQRWNRGLGRSSSFDLDTAPLSAVAPAQQRQQQPPSQSHLHHPLLEDVPQSPFQTDFRSFLDDELDAAPNPTVPSGPRKIPSSASMLPPPPEPLERPATHRNHSSGRSIKSSSGRSRVATAREAASSPMPPSASMPVVDIDSAPAPNVGYGKPKELATSASSPALPQKDRPGFFKRVFGGGSSSKTSLAPPPTADSKRPPRLDSVDAGSDSPGAGKPQQKPTSTPPSRDVMTSHSNHPPLQKKTSSFFRRRKKTPESVPPLPSGLPATAAAATTTTTTTTTTAAPADVEAPPVPPLNVEAEQDAYISKPMDSPVSSLRHAMDHFMHETTPVQLKSSAPLADITNTAPQSSTDGYRRDFSPDYEPSPNARIRKVQSNLENDNGTPTKSPSTDQDAVSRNDSFLDLDGGSDNDDPTPLFNPLSGSRPMDGTSSQSGNGNPGSKRPPPTTTYSTMPRERRSTGNLRSVRPDSGANLALPLEGTTKRRSGSTSPRSPVSAGTPASITPSVRIDMPASDQPAPKGQPSHESMRNQPLDEPEFVVGEPTEDDRQKAQKIFDGIEDFIQKEKAAAWMGEEGPVRQRTLQAYMDLYDFADQSVVYALRQVCGRLVLRAETQQVDRILVAFSKRWCECNPNHGFKATDVIHTICYSIMLLNTDLHMADIESKMTRSQFVRNTMGTIVDAAISASEAEAASRRPSTVPERSSMLDDDPPPPPTVEDRKLFRNSFRPPPRLDGQAGDGVDDCGPLVKTRYAGTMKGWEDQVEIVLKSIYNSIRDERLPLFGAADASKSAPVPPSTSQSNLSVMHMLKRSPSSLSKTPSDGNLSVRGRVAEGRANTSRWTSKSRSRPGIGRSGFNSSRTSFDDNNSIWSPPLSSSATWSRQSLGRTQTSVSQDSLGSTMLRGDYQQSIGFANALSQAIIRDDDGYGNESVPSVHSADMSAQLLEDESLELTGPPWVKEGMVIHKHHLDGVDKKAKERSWNEVFAVIQKGHMGLFSFAANKSTRQKSRTRAAAAAAGGGGTVVGGGNWQDNATSVGSFSLRQTLASALPPPGYSRSRPHVWALSLPTGAVHLFQVGTPELIKEFVTTANYWSARLSTHPLIGGISNMEFGWSEAVVNNALLSAINNDASSISNGPPGSSGTGSGLALPSTAGTLGSRDRSSRPGSSAATGHIRKSSVGSFRSASLDHAAAALTNAASGRTGGGGGGKLPGDRIHIAEWTPPAQSMRPSTDGESEQLRTLQAYVKGIEEELQAHNQLRSPMLLAFTPRGQNAIRAMSNWERKSAYLLREIVKFRTYVDCLQQAEMRKQDIYAERDLAHRAARGELDDEDMDSDE
ncbi:Guanine-nucleotide exchange factor, contains Sec7 domain [Geosmithia morbida]|uniref:Guanine-nucleotide exchange factor, contains Sec7 domain n=1 Tax=Geosmithia morbida TaxID=1094350 RepID=A0A9P4Z285_9HYPO|nr:Guanine-nucleotide exchange factor, contains Sec7 domain [Geosmithia morbida]KAF4126086.1 Guanine-nucleotide exchange factor, contains Sec7 domain [Geosmithia morbida]